MSQFLGADVSGLDQMAERYSHAASAAHSIRDVLTRMSAELRFHGRYGEEFNTYLCTRAMPELDQAASALARFQVVLRAHAQAQRTTSDGANLPVYQPIAMLAAAAATAPSAGVTAPPDRRSTAELTRAYQDTLRRAASLESYADRDAAYRQAIRIARVLDARELERLQHPGPLTEAQLRNINRIPPPPPNYARISFLQQRLATYERVLGESHQIIHFDRNAAGGDGEIAFVVGRPIDASTSDVVVLVPGMTTDLNSFGNRGNSDDYLDHAERLDAAAPRNVATVLYLGFDAPDNLIEANYRESLYHRGGQRLADFVNNDLRAHAPNADVHLLPHSAGGPVAGRSLQLGAQVNSVTFLAPAGAGPGVDSLADYQIPPDRPVRFAVMQINRDLIGLAPENLENRGRYPQSLPGVRELPTWGYPNVGHTEAYFQDQRLRDTIIRHIMGQAVAELHPTPAPGTRR